MVIPVACIIFQSLRKHCCCPGKIGQQKFTKIFDMPGKVLCFSPSSGVVNIMLHEQFKIFQNILFHDLFADIMLQLAVETNYWQENKISDTAAQCNISKNVEIDHSSVWSLVLQWVQQCNQSKHYIMRKPWVSERIKLSLEMLR